MNDKLKKFINENLDLINQNTKESWEEIYYKLNDSILRGKFTEVILKAGINDPAKIMGKIPSLYLCKCNISEYKIPNNITSIGNSAFAGCSNLTMVAISNSVTNVG